jgi:hypothetical protein
MAPESMPNAKCTGDESLLAKKVTVSQQTNAMLMHAKLTNPIGWLSGRAVHRPNAKWINARIAQTMAPISCAVAEPTTKYVSCKYRSRAGSDGSTPPNVRNAKTASKNPNPLNSFAVSISFHPKSAFLQPIYACSDTPHKPPQSPISISLRLCGFPLCRFLGGRSFSSDIDERGDLLPLARFTRASSRFSSLPPCFLPPCLQKLQLRHNRQLLVRGFRVTPRAAQNRGV